MIKAVRIHANGGPEVMRCEEIALPPPAVGEARVRHTAIGINYSDINVRRGGFYLACPLRFGSFSYWNGCTVNDPLGEASV